MIEFLNLEPESFGLDISDLSLKIIKLSKKGDKFRISSFGETKIKPGIVKGGEIKDRKKLVAFIKKALKEVKGKKINTKYVISSLPEEKSFLEVIQMPLLSKEDLKSAVLYQAENYIPLPVEKVYLDPEIISKKSDHYEVLLVALPREIVDPYFSSLREAGLEPIVLEPESLSIVRALIKKEKISEPLLIIDFGASRTTFIIFAQNSVRFTSTIPISSQGFTELIAKALKTDLATAERLKRKFGLEGEKKVFLKGEPDKKYFKKRLF